ncbi:a disintegrin and metalloproteinase with thrombospondin motifs 16 [Mytilus galloprovincialis]|uniref:A disintegrin and metalloproteinase with thrombospondin motifs 16 n=1 Tax=Mytilus galloprovincialis TaxID=29158 RepID=A0A8B6DM57_MYTGA|nr:a disintegrin and metalloproteinase with thrombospondin motifs 16 [Mytilus galloprovincialis]
MDWMYPLPVGVYFLYVIQLFSRQSNAEIPTNYGAEQTQNSNEETFPREISFDIRQSDVIETLDLKRNPNIDINVPMCSLETGNVICELGTSKDVAFYQSKDQTGAFSLKISKDNHTELDGYLVTNNTAYVLEPSGKLANTFKNNSHYLRKRSAGITSNRHRSFFTQYLGHNMVHLSRRQVDPRDNYITDSDFDMPSTFTVEVLILIDHSLYKKFYKKHGNDDDTMTKLRYYFTHVVNGIDLRFSSINNTDFHIKVKLAGFFVAKDPTDMPFVLTYSQGQDKRSKVDGSTTLLGLTNFLKKSTNLPKHDHAMFFTEHDATNGRGYILGTSYLSGICTSMSTSVIVDHGSYNSGGIAAHELGHNLGVIHHDGDSVPEAANCPSAMNYIMAPSSAIINRKTVEYSFKFSDCSIYQMKQQVKKMRELHNNCLGEDSSGSSVTNGVVKPFLSVPPGQIMNVHGQCQEIYGNTSFMCPPSTIDEMCYKMYCFDPVKGICITASEQRAAMGTSCGDKKWCMLGKCIFDESAPSAPDNCPFPDVPPPKANCEQDASPFQCQDSIFKKRCCQSCSKNFTEEDYCTDTKILINGLSCLEFITKYGTYICHVDPSIKDFCCRSCHTLEQNIPTTYSPYTTNTDCTDNTYVRINGLHCTEFVAQNGKSECVRPLVAKHCCRSCYY